MTHAARDNGNMSFRNAPKDAPREDAIYRRRCHAPRTTASTGSGFLLLFRSARCMLYLCLTLACGAQAAEPNEGRRPAEGSKKNTPAERTKETERSKPVPRTFVPTEKIKADSAISFPVDI